MARITLTLMIYLLATLPLFSQILGISDIAIPPTNPNSTSQDAPQRNPYYWWPYYPIVEPDPAYLPAILDSTINFAWDYENNDWRGADYRIHTYDVKGNLTQTIEYNWDYEKWDWIESSLSVYTYNSSGNLVESIFYVWWDSDSNDWTGSIRSVRSFDVKGNLIEEIIYDWDSNIHDWVAYGRPVYTYDANGNQIEKTYYNWDSNIHDWVKTEHIIYAYDAKGNNTVVIIAGSSRTIKTYDDSGQITMDTHYSWDWVGITRKVYTYNASGNQTEYSYFEWNSEMNDWVGFDHKEYSYDSNGLLIETNESHTWDSENNAWIGGGYRMQHSYDDIGNLIENLWDFRDVEPPDWISSGLPSGRTVLSYNTNEKITSLFYYRWDPDIDDWLLREKSFAYWSDLATPIATNSTSTTCLIYPNPANTHIHINTEYSDHYSLEIISINGQHIFTGEMEGTTHQIDLSYFQKGIYFITIRSKDFVATEKIIKL